MPLTHQVRHVFSKIGYRFVCEYFYDLEMRVVDGKYRIPNNVVKVLDVSHCKSGYGSGQSLQLGQRPHKRGGIQFIKSAYEMKFPQFHNGTLYGFGYKFYEEEDDFGQTEMMIPEEAYQACYDYAIWENIKILSNPQHPQWQQLLILYQTAMRSISEATGNLNEYTPADHRNLREIR